MEAIAAGDDAACRIVLEKHQRPWRIPRTDTVPTPERKRARPIPDRAAVIRRAIRTAKKAAPDLAELADFLFQHAPGRPLASKTIRAAGVTRESSPRVLETAITLPWCAFDSEEMRNVLAVDVDHADGLERAEALAKHYGVPHPTLVIDPWSGRSHAIWLLKTPVPTTDRALQKPQALANRAVRLLAAAMGGTPMPQRGLIKSPFGRTKNLDGSRLRRSLEPHSDLMWRAYRASGEKLMWITVPGDLRPLELLEVTGDRTNPSALAEDYGANDAAMQQDGRSNIGRKQEPDSSGFLGRNHEIFERSRLWALRHGVADFAAILAQATGINSTFTHPLPHCAVKATARSIAKFMQKRYRRGTGPGQCSEANRKAAAEAGKRSGPARIARTEAKIAAAIAKLRAEGKATTQAAIAAVAQISVRTVQRRRNRKTIDIQPEGGDTSYQIIELEVPLRSNVSLRPATLAGLQKRQPCCRTCLPTCVPAKSPQAPTPEACVVITFPAERFCERERSISERRRNCLLEHNSPFGMQHQLCGICRGTRN